MFNNKYVKSLATGLFLFSLSACVKNEVRNDETPLIQFLKSYDLNNNRVEDMLEKRISDRTYHRYSKDIDYFVRGKIVSKNDLFGYGLVDVLIFFNQTATQEDCAEIVSLGGKVDWMLQCTSEKTRTLNLNSLIHAGIPKDKVLLYAKKDNVQLIESAFFND